MDLDTGLDRDLADRIEAIGERHEVAGMGVCRSDEFAEVRIDLLDRRRQGSHAGLGFTYREPDVSTAVRRSFPWARRLVVVAWPYLPEAGNPGPPRPGTARIARFATEDHYRGLHTVLSAIADELRAAGHRAEPLADDDRLVDRAAAVRAGVGWWGKNSMVLAPGHGPWLLLGSVATDAGLEPSPAMTRTCGSCSACIPACPTGALVAPGVLDARKCLARWAQAPGVIPREYRAPMGDRLYGCDDCIEACPPGRGAMEGATRRRGRVDVLEVLAAPDTVLVERHRHFYLPKRHPRILRRNALVVLANSGVPEALPVLAGYLGHPDPVLRIHAAWGLGRLGGDASHAVLATAAATEPDPAVRTETALALDDLRSPS